MLDIELASGKLRNSGIDEPIFECLRRIYNGKVQQDSCRYWVETTHNRGGLNVWVMAEFQYGGMKGRQRFLVDGHTLDLPTGQSYQLNLKQKRLIEQLASVD